MLYYEKLERGEKKLRISNYSVENRLISFLDTANITGNENVDTFHFDFDTEWNVFSSKYFILVVDGKAYIDMLDSNNNVILRDVVYDNDNVTFGVYGISGSSKLSSNIVWLETIPSAFGQIKEVDGLPDKTVWELYTEEMLALVAQGQITLEQCQQALNDTQTARDLAQGYMNDAKGYSEDAEGYKNDTAGLKQDVVDIVNSFNANVTQKTNEFNQNATDKTNTFNQNVTDKTTSFNNNATSKTNDFNSNVTQKTNTFNQNAQDKLDAVTQVGTRAVGNVQDAEALAITHIQTEGASYDVRLDNLEAVIGTGTDTFSASSTYEVGDVVVYENKLYRCITAITTAGAWDSTKWEEINVRQEQDEQNEKIKQLEEHVELIESNYNTDTATGSDLDITDALNGYNKGIAVCGNTTQAQSTGKNLFDDSNLTFTNAIKNSNGEDVASTSSHYTNNYSTVAPETTYTLSGTIATATSAVRVYYYDSNKNWIGRSNDIVSNPTFTTPANCYFIQFQVNMVITLQTGDVQLELGSTATEYEPYTGGQPSPSPDYPQEIVDVTGTQTITISDGTNTITKTLHLGDIHIRSIPDTEYKDRIYHENGKWWLEQNINQEVLDETGSWTKSSSGATCDRFILAKNTTRNKIKVFNALSNYFINNLRPAEQIIGQFSIDSNTNTNLRGRVFINFSEYGATTLEQFLTWISTHNIIIQYILGTSIPTEITDQTLIDDLNTLLPIQTHREHTIIQVTPETGNPAQIEIKYLKDDRVADLISELELLKARVDLLEG